MKAELVPPVPVPPEVVIRMTMDEALTLRLLCWFVGGGERARHLDNLCKELDDVGVDNPTHDDLKFFFANNDYPASIYFK